MRQNCRPRTLFGRTAVTLFVVSAFFQVLMLGLILYFLLIPLSHRSADDLAALILESAAHWQEAAPAEKRQLAQELRSTHGLRVEHRSAVAPSRRSLLPYSLLLGEHLDRQTDKALPITTSKEGDTRWYHAHVPVGDGFLRFSYTWQRIGARLPMVGLLGLAAGIVVVVFTTGLIVRRIIQPLARLGRAADRVGQGLDPGPLPETGPRELAQLARTFNQMSGQVQELLANRTTLLAGVSHDLKTPVTRLRLAVNMLPPETDRDLVDCLEGNLDNMSHLLDQYLDLARGLHHETEEATNVTALLEDVTRQENGPGTPVSLHGCSGLEDVVVRGTALRRVIENLVENGLRYGDPAAGVEIRCRQTPAEVMIRILDRGPGIPAEHREAVFRPFFRLEQSRNADSGGSGLGLATCRQLADANGWRIGLYPRPGRGIEARLVIPWEISSSPGLRGRQNPRRHRKD